MMSRCSRRFLLPLVVFLFAALLTACGGAGGPSAGEEDGSSAAYTNKSNLHLIDSHPNGFAVYRSGAPSAEDIGEWCRLGITEVMVLSGNAESHEEAFRERCPQLQVVYNEEQVSRTPLTASFLQYFDSWVEDAQQSGKRILFRCNCGCHRTGRLAGYYEMKYMSRSYQQALDNMLLLGEDMDSHKFLFGQLSALEDFIDNRPCSQPEDACVMDDLQ